MGAHKWSPVYFLWCTLVTLGVRAIELGGLDGTHWESTFGNLQFANGSASYVRGDIFIEELRLPTLTGKWMENGAGCSETFAGTNSWGNLEFVFNEELTLFEGVWGNCDNEALFGNWNGKLLQTESPSPTAPAPATSVTPINTSLVFVQELMGKTWTSTFGKIVFQLNENQELESYYGSPSTGDDRKNLTQLQVRGDFDLLGLWVEPGSTGCDIEVQGSRNWGRFAFTFDESLEFFSGKYGFCAAEPNSNWSGQAEELASPTPGGAASTSPIPTSPPKPQSANPIEPRDLVGTAWSIESWALLMKCKRLGECKYDDNAGRLANITTFSRDSLEGTWEEDREGSCGDKDGKAHGRMILTFDSNRTTFNGVWGSCDEEPGARIFGTRQELDTGLPGESPSPETTLVQASASSAPVETSEEAPACFPASATVQIEHGGRKTMSELEIGDRVLTGSGFSPVFFFSHRAAHVRTSFVQMTASNRSLSLSPSHLVPLASRGGELVPASRLQVGDRLMQVDGEITHIATISDVGLYHPHTAEHSIVVDGLLVSCFTTAVPPALARVLLLPISAAHRIAEIGTLRPAFHTVRGAKWAVRVGKPPI